MVAGGRCAAGQPVLQRVQRVCGGDEGGRMGSMEEHISKGQRWGLPAHLPTLGQGLLRNCNCVDPGRQHSCYNCLFPSESYNFLCQKSQIYLIFENLKVNVLLMFMELKK